MLDIENTKSLEIGALANLFVDVHIQLDDAKSIQAEIQKDFDLLRKEIIPTKMEDLGFSSIAIKGVGRLGLRSEAYASMVKDKKPEAMAWLEKNGHGDLIKETVNASTLKAFLKEQIIEGEIIPDDLFNFSPYMMATITKT